MKPFFWKIVICVFPLALATWTTVESWIKYENGEGGFKLGYDLAGGTYFIFEIDDKDDSKTEESTRAGRTKSDLLDELAANLKRRIDPTDLYNVTIQPIPPNRIEVILPTGGRQQERVAEEAWQDLLKKVKEIWPLLSTSKYSDQLESIGRGRVRELASAIHTILQ